MARGFSGVKDDLIDIRRHILGALCFFPPISDDESDSSPESRNPNTNPVPNPMIWRMIGGDDGWMRENLVRFISDMDKSPESWLQFPFPVDDSGIFSEQLLHCCLHKILICHSNQRDHIANVECVARSLAALKISMCPTVMTEQRFWKIYFALLHPRLNNLESEFLSTEQIVEEMHMNLKKRMQARLNAAEPQHAAAESSSLMTTDKEIDTQKQEQSLVNSDSQHLIPDSSSSISTKKKATSFDYIDKWFDTSLVLRETDNSTETRQQFSNIEVDSYGESQNTDNIVLQSGYKFLSRVETEQDFSSISSGEQLLFRKKSYSDVETSDWHPVEYNSSDYDTVSRY